MDLTDIFSQPVLRRCWLLNKALENASFDEALKLAQAVDEFLRADVSKASVSIPINPIAHSSEAPHYAILPKSVLSAAVERGSDHLHPTDIDRDAAEIIVVELRRSLEDSSDELSDDLGNNPQIASQVAVENGLLVMANQEEIVRYLRQRDDVVVPAGANAYLVNGRFRLNFDEMLARANKMRERQGKPLFQPIHAN